MVKQNKVQRVLGFRNSKHRRNPKHKVTMPKNKSSNIIIKKLELRDEVIKQLNNHTTQEHPSNGHPHSSIKGKSTQGQVQHSHQLFA